MEFYLLSFAVILTGIIISVILLRKTEKKKNTFLKVLVCIYCPLIMWSAFFYVKYLMLSGLSMVWVWADFALFGLIRVIMLTAEIKGKPVVKISPVIRTGYRICFALCLLVFIVIEGLIIQDMENTPEKDLDYVIVLGAGVSGDVPSPTLCYRIDTAGRYMQDNPDTILIASGGQGPDEDISEGECIKKYLTGAYGITEERILVEDKSVSTEENLRFSRQFIEKDDARVGIITSGFHEFRAGMIAEREGYNDIYSVPADSVFPVGIHYTVREFFGVVYLFIRR
ncbi:MAG: YdcF family protein [Lachnospiraceae bacterium]|nr:YdcF family protein [Lachnospiraceae bacterium]